MLTPSSRMRNGLAEDVLDKKMLLLMKVYIVYFVLNSYNYIPCKAGYRFTTPQFFILAMRNDTTRSCSYFSASF